MSLAANKANAPRLSKASSSLNTSSLSLRKKMLEFSHVSFERAKKSIISRLSFSLLSGQIIVLFGPSGCGKTSILNLACSILEPDFGKVNSFSHSFSFVFQDASLLPFKTALENVLLCSSSKDAKEAKALLELLYFKPHDCLKYPNELSGGMKSRVNFARALASDADIFLLDEPFAALNWELKNFMLKILFRLVKERGKAALFVTHDRFEALKSADIIYVLAHGKVIKRVDLKEPRELRGERFISKYLSELGSDVFYE